MKTLKQLREDPRIYEINVQDLEECESKYCVLLNDGYTFDGYSGAEWCNTVAEINELLKDVLPYWKQAALETGKAYKNRNGITYKCVGYETTNSFKMISEGGYCCTAHNITMYGDGTIEWDYSTGGKFVEQGA